jgi:hypothetical protein
LRVCGSQLAPSVPAGHILLQAGLQLEWLTAGLVSAGMHEVVVTEQTVSAVQRTLSQRTLSQRTLSQRTVGAGTAAAGGSAAASLGAQAAGHTTAGNGTTTGNAPSAAAAEHAPSAAERPPSLWRVSSTLFAHVHSERTLKPLLTHVPARLAAARAEAGHAPLELRPDAYPAVTAGEQVVAELKGIALARA